MAISIVGGFIGIGFGIGLAYGFGDLVAKDLPAILAAFGFAVTVRISFGLFYFFLFTCYLSRQWMLPPPLVTRYA